MSEPRQYELALKVSQYRAFGEEPQGFDRILPVNIIIGRNNSGKSSLIDLIEWAASVQSFEDEVGLQPSPSRLVAPAVHLTQTHSSLMDGSVPGHSIEPWMKQNRSSDPLDSWREYTDKTSWVDIREFWETLPVSWVFGDASSASIPVELDEEVKRGSDIESSARQFIEHAILIGRPIGIALPIAGKSFHRIAAERSVGPEEFDDSPLSVSASGEGVTNVLYRFITDAELPREVVEERLLSGLNSVFEPDASFSGIQVQRFKGQTFEVFLVEKDKGPVPLSASGSGLQTVILVLVALDVLPSVPGSQAKLKEWIFAFE